MPHRQSYGQDKFAFCWVRILATFELQTLISSNPGPVWSWNSLGCNFNSGWTENIERLGWFKSFEASKTQLEQQSRFTDLTSTSSAAFITENASVQPVRLVISINRVQFTKLQDKRERPSEFQLDSGLTESNLARFTSQRLRPNHNKVVTKSLAIWPVKQCQNLTLRIGLPESSNQDQWSTALW